jgi:2-amino-4-hydroxy-6-hydroxymethyldihydropteridine diphosphokinase
MSLAYVALGSNLDDPASQLRSAVHALRQLEQSEIQAVSQVYRSAAVGPGRQPDYLNAVVRLKTTLDAEQLLAALQDIETAQGRTRRERWAARTLDLDLLLYDELQLHNDTLTLPHPRMRQRPFVLFPLRDVAAANLVLPDGTELDTLLAECPREELRPAGLDLTSEAMC